MMKIPSLILSVTISLAVTFAAAQEPRSGGPREEPRGPGERRAGPEERRDRDENRAWDERHERMERQEREERRHREETEEWRELERHVHAFFDEQARDPEFKKVLNELRERDRDHYERAMHHLRHVIQDYRHRRERGDEKLADDFLKVQKMDLMSHITADDIRGMAEGPEREGEMADLQALLGEIFDLKQELRRADLERIEEEASRLAELLEKREANREKVIEHRLKELLPARGDEFLEW